MSEILSIPETVGYECCSKNCLRLYHLDGSIDYLRTSHLITQCRESISSFTENRDSHAKAEEFTWWMSKLSSCLVKSSENNERAVFQYLIGDLGKNIYKENVCRTAFIIAYGFTDNQLAYKLEQFKKHIRMGVSKDDIELPTKTLSFIDRVGRVVAKHGNSEIATGAFERTGLGDANNDLIRAALLPDSEKGILCSEWLTEYFMCCGDCVPNSANEVHISECTKESIYDQYVKDKEDIGQTYLSLSSFNRLWIRLFSNYKIRKWRQVGGKCNTCALLDSIRSETKNRELKRRVTDYVLLHRSMYMNERRAYYSRRMLAHSFPDQYMSIITDGMAQIHSELPWQKNLVDAGQSGKLNQHLQGVLEHGQSVNIFRVFENLPLDTNHGVHDLLMVLEKRLRKDKQLPGTIFIQIDGGKENTSRAFLSICELLVSSSLTNKIIVSRLPPGHTHEDIDAVFAQIWSVLQKHHAKSPQRYAELIKQALGVASKRTEEVFVYDLFCIPNYIEYLTPYIDWKISDYAQGDKTQLQFCFEKTSKALDRFPLGVKVKYRRYSADKCVELTREINAPGGVPLKAYIVHSKWCDKSESFSFFKSRPKDVDSILPCSFRQNCHQKFQKVMEYVKDKFEPHYYDQWKEFAKRFPNSDNSQDYLTNYLQGNLYIPLKDFLFRNVTLDCETVVDPTKPMKERRSKSELIQGHKKANACVRNRYRQQRIEATTIIQAPNKRNRHKSSDNIDVEPSITKDSSDSSGASEQEYEGGKCLPVNWGPLSDSAEEDLEIKEYEQDFLHTKKSSVRNKRDSVKPRKKTETHTCESAVSNLGKRKDPAKLNSVNTLASRRQNQTSTYSDSSASGNDNSQTRIDHKMGAPSRRHGNSTTAATRKLASKRARRHQNHSSTSDADSAVSEDNEISELDDVGPKVRQPRISKTAAIRNLASQTSGPRSPHSEASEVQPLDRPSNANMSREELFVYCQEHYELVLGLRVNVWYPQNKSFFKGTVTDYDPKELEDQHWRVDFDVGGHAYMNISTVLDSEVTTEQI